VRTNCRRFHGAILDCRNRYWTYSELGIRPPFEGITGTEAEAVDSWNLHRRYLTEEFWRQRTAEMKSSGDEQSRHRRSARRRSENGPQPALTREQLLAGFALALGLLGWPILPGGATRGATRNGDAPEGLVG